MYKKIYLTGLIQYLSGYVIAIALKKFFRSRLQDPTFNIFRSNSIVMDLSGGDVDINKNKGCLLLSDPALYINRELSWIRFNQ
ncbi:hypothetical protein, partial [Methanospirillum sp.]|uniref:hypothetical protein n=1 Tax=Methanospirillum sp. TaxID=45200 RepID=UPI001BD5D992